MNTFDNIEFTTLDSNNPLNIGDTIFYVFDSFDNINIIKGILTDININLSNNFKYSFKIMCSNSGKEYSAGRDKCFSSYSASIDSLISKTKDRIKNLQLNYNTYHQLYKNVNEYLVNNFRAENQQIPYKNKTIFNESFKFFEPEEKVYFYFDPKFLNNKTIIPVFLGEIVSFSGIISCHNTEVKYSIEHDYDDYIVSNQEIFYTEKEAITYCLIKIQEKIDSIQNNINLFSNKLNSY